MNNLVIKNKKGTPLTASNWKEGFIAVDEERHWEEGRSAERLAHDFSDGAPSSGEKSLRDAIRLFLKTDDIIWHKAYIEHGSRFDRYRRPRMQDLAIWGEANGESFFIGVEAKVDEPFGSRNVKEQKEYIKSLKKQSKAGDRLNELTADFLAGIDEEKYGGIRYQLLYYLAGSFREDADIIIMPVFAYHSDKYDSVKGRNNYNAYEDFMKKLGFTRIDADVEYMEAAYVKEITTYDRTRKKILTKTVYSCYFEK